MPTKPIAKPSSTGYIPSFRSRNIAPSDEDSVFIGRGRPVLLTRMMQEPRLDRM
jgi:hypothetical protein